MEPTEQERIQAARAEARQLGFLLMVEEALNVKPWTHMVYAAPALAGRPSMGEFLSYAGSAPEAAEAGLAELQRRGARHVHGQDEGHATESASVTIQAPPATVRAEAPPPRIAVSPTNVSSEDALRDPEIKKAAKSAWDYGWQIAFVHEPNGTVTSHLIDDTNSEVLKTAVGDDFHDSILELMKVTLPPSSEVRRAQQSED